MMMQDSIFGINPPKFKRGTTTVMINYWVTTKDEPESFVIRHQSDINKHREYDYFTSSAIEDHWVFEGIINLGKYTYPASKYNEINAHKRQLVQLWRHADGDYFKNTAGSTVYFLLKEIIPFCFDKPGFPDRLLLKFESQDFVDVSKALPTGIIPQPEEIVVDDSIVIPI
jgi:hypothetical protein